MIVGTKTPLFTQGQFIAVIFVIILLKIHREQSPILSTMCLFHSQAVAQDNSPQLSTQLQQVTGLLGINMSHSEARKKGWRDGNVHQRSFIISVSGTPVFIFGHAAAFKADDLQVTTQRGASCKRRTQTKVTFEFFLADQTSIWFFYEVGIVFHLPKMC